MPKTTAEIIIQPQKRASKIITSCWAHTHCCKSCHAEIKSREGEPIPIPYCQRHLKCRDGALKIVHLPGIGRCLVACFHLPRGYQLVFHGNRGKCPTSDRDDHCMSFYPPNPITGSNYHTEDGICKQKTNNYNGVLNPTETGDLLQFAACPGPSERQNVKSKFQYFGIRNGSYGGLEFVTIEDIPRNTQLAFWYGPRWFSVRGLKRQNAGTPRYPLPKKRTARVESDAC